MLAEVLAVGMAVVLLTTMAPLPASAAGWGATWRMEETSGSMRDSSGHGNGSSSLGAGITRTGWTYQFADPAAGPRGYVTVPDSASLRPGARPFTVEARVRSWTGDRNIVQKGLHSASGHQWKLEIAGDAYTCVFHGTGGEVRVGRATGVVGTVKTGVWQTVACRRTPTSVQLLVDGQVRASRVADPGFISTLGKPVTIGGKSGCTTNCDFFVGTIGQVTVSSP